MASWSTTFSAKSQYTLTLNVTERSGSVNVANNTSIVDYSLVMSVSGFSAYTDVSTEVSIWFDGTDTAHRVYHWGPTRRDFNPSAQSTYTETIATGNKTITHDSDGSKTLKCYATVSTDTYSDFAPGTATISNKSLPLTTIPRKSTVSASGQYIGDTVAITITRASSSFTHDLTYSFEGHTGTIATGVGTSYSWTPALATFGPYIPNTTSGSCTITCTTKSGGTSVGSTTTTLTLSLKDTVKPNKVDSTWKSASYVNSGGASSLSVFVQKYSKLKVDFNSGKITFAGGATFQKYVLTVAGVSKDGTGSSITTDGTVQTSGTVTYTAYVYDSRGRYFSESGTITVYPYANPAITSSSIFRCDSSGVADSSGAYISVTGTASVSSINGLNDYELQARYKPANGSWSGWYSLDSGDPKVIGGSLSPSTTYKVEIYLHDTPMNNSATTSATVPTEDVTFNLKDGGKGAAFGKYAETDNLLDLASTWQLAQGAGIAYSYTNDVLASALAQDGGTVKAYRGSGSGYTGSVPNSYFGYGSFLVFCRATTSIIIIALSSRPTDGIAINFYNGSWSGWSVLKDRYVDKTQSVTFSAGTIGTRAQAYSWSSGDIGGAPTLMQVVDSSGLANFMPICTISGTNAYLNIYRAVSTAYSSGSITVRIWY